MRVGRGGGEKRRNIYDVNVAVCLAGGIRSFPQPGVHERIGKYLVEDSGADVFFVATLGVATGNPLSNAKVIDRSSLSARGHGEQYNYSKRDSATRRTLEEGGPPPEDEDRLLRRGLDYLRASVVRGKAKRAQHRAAIQRAAPLPHDKNRHDAQKKLEEEGVPAADALSYLRVLPASACEHWWQLQVEDGYASDLEAAKKKFDCDDHADFTAALMQTLWLEQCFRHVAKEELLRGIRYDIVVRGRPDNGVFAPIPWEEVPLSHLAHLPRVGVLHEWAVGFFRGYCRGGDIRFIVTVSASG